MPHDLERSHLRALSLVETTVVANLLALRCAPRSGAPTKAGRREAWAGGAGGRPRIVWPYPCAAGGVAAAFEQVRALFPGLPVEVEVDSLAQLTEVLDAGADLVLLDNFTPDQMRLAVGIAREHAAATGLPRAQLEASGGLTLPETGNAPSTN